MVLVIGKLSILLVELTAFDQLPGKGVQCLVGVVPALYLPKQGEDNPKEDDHQGKDNAQHDYVVGEQPASEGAWFAWGGWCLCHFHQVGSIPCVVGFTQ